MNKFVIPISVLILSTLSAQPAWCARFQVGDRIQIQTTKDIGTVTAVSAQGNCSIRMDDRPNDPQGSYFEKSPDLQLYNGAQQPPQAGEGGAVVNNGAGGNRQPEPAPKRAPVLGQKVPQHFPPLQPLGGNLTEAIVKAMVEDNYKSVIHPQYETMTFTWDSVEIGGPHKVNDVELAFQQIAPGTLIYPVRAVFTYKTQSINYANNVEFVDRIGYAYFYKDEFGHWAYTWYAHAGQRTSHRYK